MGLCQKREVNYNTQAPGSVGVARAAATKMSNKIEAAESEAAINAKAKAGKSESSAGSKQMRKPKGKFRARGSRLDGSSKLLANQATAAVNYAAEVTGSEAVAEDMAEVSTPAEAADSKFVAETAPAPILSPICREGAPHEYQRGWQLHRSIHASRWCITKADLKEFVKEVCEKHTSGQIPQHLDCTNDKHDDDLVGPNVHAVNDAVIKPRTREAGGMSWALMKHPEGLPADLYVSHGWSEGIYEFSDRLSESWPDEMPNAWICFLANPQTWGFGDLAELLSPGGSRSSLSESPFVQALKSDVKSMLVVPNSSGSIYKRLWCVLEIKMAADLRIPIKLAPDAKHRTHADWSVKVSSRSLPKKGASASEMVCDFVSVKSARCSYAADEALIREEIEGQDEFIDRVIRYLSKHGRYYP
mmetsp:Transcript_115400/g.337443  ORF Transcript_115400/g.337443 Transcript_115400/m.337443 type:complete len:416 (-) Transcript_115400:53-1300(-)